MSNKGLGVYDLRCEYRRNPLGIDVLKPRISWKIKSNKRNTEQAAYQIQVSMDDCEFENIIWDTGMIESDQSIHVEYQGPELLSKKKYYYRVRVKDKNDNCSEWSNCAYWEMGLLDTDEWIADWITPDYEINPDEYEPSPLLRKSFDLNKNIKKARIYVSALGLYELNLNGVRVGEDYFTPGWTSYNRRLQYQTYDVTDLLQQGENAVGIILGAGWFRGDLMWEDSRNFYGKRSAAILQLHIVDENGDEEIITSNQGWKATSGPILMSEIYHGEVYDARREISGWNQPGFDDSSWTGVTRLEQDKDRLIAQENEPVRKVGELKPVEIIKTPAGETVLDMGQNMVGWINFKVKGEEGEKVILKHAEVLDKEGNFYIDNIRSAKQTIEYTLKGDGVESFEPHFTFQGFRYVKLESYPGTPDLEDFTGIVLHSDLERTGDFSCSNQLVNQLYNNIIWGQKGNFLDVPTDCPQRDERLGWTGDAQVFIQTASLNMNVAAFFTKWLRDLKADQGEDGTVPFVIPDPNVGGTMDNSQHSNGDKMTSSSAWGDAATICPWILYQAYGDKRILAEQYESMKAWVEYIRSQGENEYLWNTGFHFGDWLALDAKENSYTGATSKDFIATSFYAYSTGILRDTADILGIEEDVKEYGRLLESILDNFHQEFVTPNGRLSEPTQTAHVLALMFDLINEKDRKRIIDTLAEYINNRDDEHLTTGFVGTPYLCHVLSENGYNELAYKLVERKEYPSWLYSITKGATTIWEHWDSIKEDGSFWPVAMNSFNHYAYGSIGDWLYQVVAGINTDPDQPGYKHVVIAPKPGGSFTTASASLVSMYGKIESNWELEDGKMRLSTVLPVNTTGTIILPAASLDSVKENDISLSSGVEGIKDYEEVEDGVKIELGSGEYKFEFLMVE